MYANEGNYIKNRSHSEKTIYKEGRGPTGYDCSLNTKVMSRWSIAYGMNQDVLLYSNNTRAWACYIKYFGHLCASLHVYFPVLNLNPSHLILAYERSLYR
jgi:hypothetical protein